VRYKLLNLGLLTAGVGHCLVLQVRPDSQAAAAAAAAAAAVCNGRYAMILKKQQTSVCQVTIRNMLQCRLDTKKALLMAT